MKYLSHVFLISRGVRGVIKSDLSQIWIVPALNFPTGVPLFSVVS